MKKWWFLIIVAAALLAVGIFSRNGEKKSAAVAGKVVVMINNGPKETNKVAVQRLKEDIARFNKIYPDIEIRWTDRPYSPDSFATSMAGGTAEDVISLWATEGYVVERGYALDLTEMLNDWQEKAQINKDVLAPFVRDGRVYALPTDGYLMGLIYNKKLFRQAGLLDGDGNAEVPANWDEFVAVAKKLTDKKGGVSGFGIMGNGAQAGWGFLNWVWQAGGDFELERSGFWQAVFAEKEAVEALEFVKNLRWKHDVLQSSLLSTSQDLQARFASDQIGMIISAQDVVPALVNQYGMKLENIGVALLPAGPAGRANQMGGNYLIINPKRPREVQEAAFKWITWRVLGSAAPERIKEKGEDLRRQGQIDALTALPIFIGQTDKKAREAAAPYKDVLVDFPEIWNEAAKYMRTEPPFFCQQLYSEYLGPAVQAVLTEKDSDPKILLAKAARGFQERFLNGIKP